MLKDGIAGIGRIIITFTLTLSYAGRCFPVLKKRPAFSRISGFFRLYADRMFWKIVISLFSTVFSGQLQQGQRQALFLVHRKYDRIYQISDLQKGDRLFLHQK